MFHPWRTLRALDHVALSWEVMPGRLGETNGFDEIRMHPHQGQAQRRCTLAHELAHLELEHTEGCNGRDEREARALAATWLIKVEHLVAAARWARSLEEAADELWVDVDTLLTRLDTLTDDEREQIVAARRIIETGA